MFKNLHMTGLYSMFLHVEITSMTLFKLHKVAVTHSRSLRNKETMNTFATGCK